MHADGMLKSGVGRRVNREARDVFTGIVEEVGTIQDARDGALVVRAEKVLEDLKIGDSVAVDGTCLTAVDLIERTFAVTVQPETLRRTIIGGYRVGQRVNLERALLATGRLGGHIVQGHVDGTGRIVELRPDGDGLIVRFEAPREVMRFIVTKGLIAIN